MGDIFFIMYYSSAKNIWIGKSTPHECKFSCIERNMCNEVFAIVRRISVIL